MIYFTMKNLNENRAFLGMLCFLLVFSCSKEKEEGNGNGDGNGDATKYTLGITKPTNGTLSSNAGGINCGSKGSDCEAEFSKGTKVTLTATADTGYAPGAWQGACDKTKADQACKLTMNADKTVGLMFSIDIDKNGVPNTDDVDDDNDGLIEIHNLDMFDHIRHNLAGTSYKTGADAEDNRMGAPDEPTANCKTATMDGGKSLYLCGYELTRDLDFAEGASYANGSINTNWRPNNPNPDSATNEGFVGIDSGFGIEENIPSIFEGNGYTISNFYSRNTDDMSTGDGTDGNPIARVGLFKSTEAKATIRNLVVMDARLYGSASDNEQIGSLVSKNKGTIIACHATGEANGGDGVDHVGGLVGANTTGTITDSHATVVVNGDTGKDRIGGLVGYNNKGSIRDSHATGAVNGGGGIDRVGGLVGRNEGNIVASSGTGAVNGGAGNKDHVGGLVGHNESNIVASSATGNANGGNGQNSNIGGLVGANKGNIIASYATGNVIGSPGNKDRVGALVGLNDNGSTIMTSYAKGNANGGAGNGDHVGGLVGTNKGSIVSSYAKGNANSGAGDTEGVGGLAGYSNHGSILASYATGDADGSSRRYDRAGNLVGELYSTFSVTGSITVSYGFGSASNGINRGLGTAHPVGVQSISGKANKVNALTAPGGGANTDVDAKWNNVGQKTKDAWNFGTNMQAPALQYADYDGDMADTDYCALFPDKIPGTDDDLICGGANASLLPGQRP